MKTRIMSHDKKYRKIIWTATLWVAAGLMASTTVRADIYTWQDAQGVIHFSNQDVPPQAVIHMKEPVPGPQDNQAPDPQPQYRDELDIEAVRQQAQTQAKLEETNLRLNEALEKVADLTDQVSNSQAQAAAAAQAAQEAAQEAAIAAERDAASAKHNQNTVTERVVVYSSPSPYRYKKHGIRHDTRNYAGHLKQRRPYDNSNRHYKQKYKNRHHRNEIKNRHKHKLNRNRHYYRNTGPAPIVPERSHFSRAYGYRSRIK